MGRFNCERQIRDKCAAAHVLKAVFLTVHMALTRWNAPRCPKQPQDIQRFIRHRRAVLCDDFFKLRTREVCERSNRREVIVDMGYLALL